jgi:3-phenylpropionate/cinnamic acid dioxygenase small subunit
MSSGLWWGFWKDYPKVTINGREYAQIGDRLYTEHAVERFLPSGRRTIANVEVADREGGGYMFHEKARSIAPAFVEDAIRRGTKKYMVVKAEPRTLHTCGDIEVVTTRDDHIVITVGYRH